MPPLRTVQRVTGRGLLIRCPVLCAVGVVLGTVAVIAACSTAPEPTGEVTTIRRQAERNIVHGMEAVYHGRTVEARTFFESALREYRSLDNRSGVAVAFAALARAHLIDGDLDAAAAYYTDSAELAAAIGSVETAVESYAALLEIETRRGRPADAEAALRAARQLLGERENERARAVLLHGAAVLAADLGRLEEAELRLQEALAINRSFGRYRETAANHYMLASVLARGRRYDEAFEHAKRALETDKLIENPIGIAQDLIALGRIQQRAGEPETALEYYERAFSVYLGLQHERGQRRVEALFAELIEGGDAGK